MKINKIFFVGLGGAGQRHLRIFRKLLPPETEFTGYRSIGKTPLLNADFSVNKNDSLKKKYNINLLNSVEEGLENKPGLIVISTPTSLHYNVAKKAAENNISVFIEKPFSHNLDGFADFKETVIKNGLCFFISFQRRFHSCLKKIKEIIANREIGKIISAVFNVCTYVPAWHPYEDFRELYACRKDLGGGVLLTEIHELDLCYWYFGLPEYVYCSGGNYSNYELDVEDTAHVSLKYKDYTVQVNLCFMQKFNRRDLYIAGTKGYIEWNMLDNKLVVNNYEDSNEYFSSDPGYKNDEMFLSQATYFLNEFNRGDKSYLEAAQASLIIVEAARVSMKEGVAKRIEV